jgi:hypothetical protein
VIGDETLDLFAVSGPPEEIGHRIREGRRGLHDRAQLYPSLQTPLDDRAPPQCRRGRSEPDRLCYNPSARGSPWPS